VKRDALIFLRTRGSGEDMKKLKGKQKGRTAHCLGMLRKKRSGEGRLPLAERQEKGKQYATAEWLEGSSGRK